MFSAFGDFAPITPYGLSLVLASMAAWAWSRLRAPKQGIDASHIDLLVPSALLGGVLGARFLTLLLPQDVLDIGTDYPLPFRLQLFGLLLAASPVVVIYAKRMRLPMRRLMDVLALPMLLWISLVRVGCFLAGCCWGDPILADQTVATANSAQVSTTFWLDRLAQPLGVTYPKHSFAWEQHHAQGLLPVTSTRSLLVHPTQLYESIGVLVLALTLWRFERSHAADGLIALAALGGYSALRFLIETVRADNVLLLDLLTLNQAICIVLLMWVASTCLGRNLRALAN